jgi:regulator of replication initiation timing
MSGILTKTQPQTMGQLFEVLFNKPTDKTPNPTPKDTEVDKLNDQIEHMHYELEDVNDKLSTLKSENDDLILSNSEFKSKLDVEYIARRSYQTVYDKANVLEHDIIQKKLEISNLKNELQTSESNRKYAMDFVQQQAELMNDAKRVINDLRSKVAESVTDKTNSEHLAKKAIELREDNQKLANVNSAICDKNNLLNDKIKTLSTEITDLHNQLDEFKKQVARLISEKSSYDCQANGTGNGSLCGGCTECQLKQAKHSLTELGDQVDKLKLQLQNTQGALNDTVSSFYDKSIENDKNIDANLSLRKDYDKLNIAYTFTSEENISLKSELEKVKSQHLACLKDIGKKQQELIKYNNVIISTLNGLTDIVKGTIFFNRKRKAKEIFENITSKMNQPVI